MRRRIELSDVVMPALNRGWCPRCRPHCSRGSAAWGRGRATQGNRGGRTSIEDDCGSFVCLAGEAVVKYVSTVSNMSSISVSAATLIGVVKK